MIYETSSAYPEFTPGAAAAVDEYTLRQRDRLVREIQRSSAHVLRDGEISTADVQVAITRLDRADGFLTRLIGDIRAMPGKFRVHLLLLGLPIAITLVAIAVLAWPAGDLADALSVLAGVVTGLLGTSATVLAVDALRNQQRRTDQGIETATQHFLVSMEELEEEIVHTASRFWPADYDGPVHLRRALLAIEYEGIWSDEDVAAFRTLMRLRNNVVYDDSLLTDRDHLALALSEPQRLRQLLQESKPKDDEEAPTNETSSLNTDDNPRIQLLGGR